MFKKEGYKVWRTTRSHWGANDFFCFDLVVIRDKEWKLISVKTNGVQKQHLKELEEFYFKNALPGMEVACYVWCNPHWEGRGKKKKYVKGWTIHRFVDDGNGNVLRICEKNNKKSSQMLVI